MDITSNPKFYRVPMIFAGIFGIVLFGTYLILGEKFATIGTVGAFSLGISWVAYCGLCGLKREQEIADMKARDCPYKVETSCLCSDFLKDRDGEGLHRCRDGGTCEFQGNRSNCDVYHSNIDGA